MSNVLSDDTINVLKNFATINPNLVFTPGQKVKTISESKTILAQADITEDMPKEFGIYDLNEFLSVYNLVEQPTLTFEDKSVLINGANNQVVRYFFSETEILTTPQKDIQMPDAELGFTLTDEILNQIRKAAAVLGHTELSLKGDNGVITASVVDTKDSTSNSFSYELDKVKCFFTSIISIKS